MGLKEKLLKYYNISEDELKERSLPPSSSLILDPKIHFKGFNEAIDLIKKHVSNKSKIYIYGDYDVDGMTSTSILYYALKEIGGDVLYSLPSRYKYGYGLVKNAVDEIYSKGIKLLITIDNGISAFEAVEYARELGMDVLIIDHHTPQDKLPRANNIIHWQVGEYTSYNISAAFLALLVSYSLLGKYVSYLVCLAGIAVFADQMKMIEMNLNIAKYALLYINKIRPLKLTLLLGQDKPRYTSSDINFNLISSLNSLGRVDIGDDINLAIEYLTSKSEERIRKLYSKINEISLKKKELAKAGRIEANSRNLHAPIIIEKFDSMQVGLIGLISTSLSSALNKPVICFAASKENEGELVGSGRAPEGIDLYGILEKYSSSYVHFGGHKQALGVTIKKDDFSDFKNKISQEYSTFNYVIPTKKYILLDESDLDIGSFDILNEFEPFGQEFESPLYCFKINPSKLKFSRDGNHIIINFNNYRGGFNFFNFPRDILDKKEDLYFKGKFDLSYYKGRPSAKFVAEGLLDLKKAEIIK